MSDASESDQQGKLNPLNKRVATGPSPPNTPESRQPSMKEADSNTFREEGPESNRHLTPDTAGITINTRPGQSTGGGKASTGRAEVQVDRVAETSAGWWLEERIKA